MAGAPVSATPTRCTRSSRKGPDAVRRLIALGARFDTDETGDIALTREGGHLRDRIAHAGGDATGAEISRALVAAVEGRAGIELIENALALDLLLDDRGAVQGLTLHVMGEGQRDGVGAVLAPCSRPRHRRTRSGLQPLDEPLGRDGRRHGARAARGCGRGRPRVRAVPPDRPLWLGAGATGQQPLVSEAVRGEGAVLRDDAGVRFMEGQHPLADLAPRDVVAKAIMRRMRETGARHVWLDARGFGNGDVGAPLPDDPRLATARSASTRRPI